MVNMAKPVEKIKGFFDELKKIIEDIKPDLKDIFQNLKSIATNVAPKLLLIFKGALKTVSYLVSSIAEFFKLFQGGGQKVDKTKALIGGLAIGLYAAVKVMKLFNKELTTGNALQKIGQTLMKGAKKLISGTISLLIGENGKRKIAIAQYKTKKSLQQGLNNLQKVGNKLLDGTKKLLKNNVVTQKLSNLATKAGNAIRKIGMGIQKGLNALQKKGILGVLKDLMGRIFSMAVTAGKAVAGIPVVGPVLAVAAIASAVAGGMMLYNKVKGDDVMSSPGKRTLFAGKDQISLNSDDTVVAGTDLFGKKKSNRSEGPDNSALIAAIDRLTSVVTTGGVVNIDGQKVAVIMSNLLALTSYKTQ